MSITTITTDAGRTRHIIDAHAGRDVASTVRVSDDVAAVLTMTGHVRELVGSPGVTLPDAVGALLSVARLNLDDIEAAIEADPERRARRDRFGEEMRTSLDTKRADSALQRLEPLVAALAASDPADEGQRCDFCGSEHTGLRYDAKLGPVDKNWDGRIEPDADVQARLVLVPEGASRWFDVWHEPECAWLRAYLLQGTEHDDPETVEEVRSRWRERVSGELDDHERAVAVGDTADALALVLRVLEDLGMSHAAAAEWLTTPSSWLDGGTALELLRTDPVRVETGVRAFASQRGDVEHPQTVPTDVDPEWLMARFSVSPNGDLACLTCGRWWRREGDEWVGTHVGHEPDEDEERP